MSILHILFQVRQHGCHWAYINFSSNQTGRPINMNQSLMFAFEKTKKGRVSSPSAAIKNIYVLLTPLALHISFPTCFLLFTETILPLMCTQDTLVSSPLPIRDEENYLFPLVLKVWKKVVRPEICWILLLSLNLRVMNFPSTTKEACPWTDNKNVFQQAKFYYN